MKEEKGTGAEAESQSQLVAKEDNKGMIKHCFFPRCRVHSSVKHRGMMNDNFFVLYPYAWRPN